MTDHELVKAVCPKCGKISDRMPFHTCDTTPPDHSAEDRELAEKIISQITYEYNYHHIRGSKAQLDSVLERITTTRRTERKEIERLRGEQSLSSQLHLDYLLLERKLTSATAALKLCERALTSSSSLYLERGQLLSDKFKLKEQALAAIKEVKK
jgi:hypothetical protein